MTPTPRNEDVHRTHPTARRLFWVTAIVASVIHWIPHFPPQIDLSQHAAQIRLLHDFLSGRDFAFRNILALNFFTPYLPAYLAGAALTAVVPAVIVVKLLWTMAALGTVYAGVRLRRVLGSGDKIDWLMLPGLFGITFQWGFLTFFFALPFGIFVVELWVRHLRREQRRTGVLVALALVALFFAHSLVAAWAMSVCAAMLLTSARTPVEMLRRTTKLLPLLSPLPVAILWLGRTRHLDQTQALTTWDWTTRYFAFFSYWLGIADRWLALAAGITLLAALVANGARLSRDPVSLAPFLVTMLMLLAGPNMLYGNAMTYNRFFSLLGPALVWALAGGATKPARSRIRQSALPLIAGACVVLFGIRMVRFAREQDNFTRVLGVMSPGQRTLSVVQEARSAALDNKRAYLHFPVWYQAERGGLVEPSFAAYVPMIVRFRRPGDAGAPFEFESRPGIAAVPQLARFKYMLVRSPTMVAPKLSAHGLGLVAHEGQWWLFARP